MLIAECCMLARMLRILEFTAVILLGTTQLWCQKGAHHYQAELTDKNNCTMQAESFPLKAQDLTVINTGDGVIFTAGMTIDADGAPNAYAPHNGGLDYTANAKGGQRWVALVTNANGHPVIQRRGPFRGYYVSTTSLEQPNVNDVRNPKRYIDATLVPYIALPPDFTRTFGIHLGDLAVVVNQPNGRSAYAIYA